MNKMPVIILLTVGLLAVSTASIFVRMVPELPAMAIAFWRMAFAGLILWSYTAVFSRGRMTPINRKRSIVAGIFLGLHFACFFGALKFTSIASATVLSTMAPVFTSLAERFIYGRTWSGRIILGLLLAIAGALVIQGGHFDLGSSHTVGNLLGVLSSIFIAVVLLVTERIRLDTGSLVLSRTLYLAAGLTMLFTTLVSGKRLVPDLPDYFIWLLLLGIIPTVIGHTSFYHAIKFVPPTVVASVPLGEPFVASTMGWIMLGEPVALKTVFGGILTIAGLLIIILQQLSVNKNRELA